MADLTPEQLMSIHLGGDFVLKKLFFYSEQLFILDQYEKWTPTCYCYLYESK